MDASSVTVAIAAVTILAAAIAVVVFVFSVIFLPVQAVTVEDCYTYKSDKYVRIFLSKDAEHRVCDNEIEKLVNAGWQIDGFAYGHDMGWGSVRGDNFVILTRN